MDIWIYGYDDRDREIDERGERDERNMVGGGEWGKYL